MHPTTRQRFRLSGGTEVSFLTAGEPSKPALLLLHGTPNTARMFEAVIPPLAQAAYVIAPDLPGFGESDVPPTASFAALGEAILELLIELSVGPRFIYLHDWGAPVGLHIAMHSPEHVLGLVVQNANAHHTGQGPGWAATKAFWADPSPENAKATTAHLTLEGTRETYVNGVPPELAAQIPAEHWEEDWRAMNLPGRMDVQRALIKDYGNYDAQFGAIAEYLARWQPPALMLWGRHDPYFDIAEVLSWMHDLPRMEAHIFDTGHLLLETHADAAAKLMLDFIRRAHPGKHLEPPARR
jgi:pimeloyl-ACP methyl ester carboxylesterase